VSTLSPWRRWQIRAIRHLTIQVAAFGIGIAIAVVCAIDGNWIAAAVVAFISMFPGTMALTLIHKMRSVSEEGRATPSSMRTD